MKGAIVAHHQRRQSATWRHSILAVVAVLGLAALVGLAAQRYVTTSGRATMHVQATYSHLPLSFEPNHGQSASPVQFLARFRGATLFLTPTEAVLAFSLPPARHHGQTADASGVPGHPRAHPGVLATPPTRRAPPNVTALRMQLQGANATPQVIGLEPLPGKHHYFLGNDPTQWHTNIPTYARVKYQAVYPGVDLVYYGDQQQVEYDFVVAPGADPSAIMLRFEGSDDVEVDAQGDLVLSTAGGPLRFQKPVIYQERDGHRQVIPGGYVRKGLHQVGFHVAAYNTARVLVIDPVLHYATYLGGSGGDDGASIAVDATGAAYVTGVTNSPDFPTMHPLQPTRGVGTGNAFVAKLTADGAALVYATYLGGSGDTAGTSIAVDAAGAAYVTGRTNSSDFPVTPGALQATFGGGDCGAGFLGAGKLSCKDAFVVKLAADGTALAYATYLGGSTVDIGSTGIDVGTSIAVDVAGVAYVTGLTISSDFPTVHPLQPYQGGHSGNAFVAKLTADGTALAYATYLGGSGYTAGASIAVDAVGVAYITGVTYAFDDFPITPGALQAAFDNRHCIGPFVCPNAFVVKLGEPAPIPSLSALAPASAIASGPAFTLTVTGTNFVPSAVLQWNGASRTTTFGSTTQLTAAIPVADLAQAGTVAVTVMNPPPGGGLSNALAFVVTNPLPSLSALAPASAIASGPAFTLTVTGANFVPDVVVQWNGASRTTTFGSDTQLTAAIPAADLAQVGTVAITVVNPPPGGGLSNALAFAVTNLDSSSVNNLDSSSGGGCTLSPGTTVDPTLVGLLGCSIAFLGLHYLRRRWGHKGEAVRLEHTRPFIASHGPYATSCQTTVPEVRKDSCRCR